MNKKNKKLNIAGNLITVSPAQMIKTLRKLKGWSQNKLSETTGISQTSIIAIENGSIQISRDTSIILAKAFRVHPASIMFPDYDKQAKL